jgi:hypothetical protein
MGNAPRAFDGGKARAIEWGAMLTRRTAVLAALLAASAPALAGSPSRFATAPKGMTFLMLAANGSMNGTYSITETSPIAGRPGDHNLESAWESERYELGFLTGYGLGPVWPLAGFDASIYIPITSRNYQLAKYLVTDDPADNQAAYGQGSLHGSEKSGKSGTGIGDIQLYANNEAGFWSCGSLKLSLPSGSSAAEKFIRIYHGEATTPGAGDGVMRLVPGLSALKMVAGQRVTFALEYGIPLGTNSFAFNAPETWWSIAQGIRFSDSGTRFSEEVTPGGILQGTVGVETSFSIFGVTPSVEVGYRQYQAAKWREKWNDEPWTDGLEQRTPPAGGTNPFYPVHTPGYGTDAAWAIAGLPLKPVTEIEVALMGTVRMRSSDVIRAGLSWISSTYGSSIGVKVTFTNLFVERPEGADGGRLGEVRAKEYEASPVLAAPPAPTGRVTVGVAFPQMLGSGLTEEEADWVGKALRIQFKGRRDYDLLPLEGMAQLGNEQCGDEECGARFGAALHVNGMLVSKLEKASDGFTLSTRLVNVADATVSSSDTVKAVDLEELGRLLPGVVDRLTAVAPAASPAGGTPR